MIYDYYAVAVAAQSRAAVLGITLHPIPPEQSEVHLETPPEHYLKIWDTYANVVVMDQYDGGADIYHDLIPGYQMMGTFLLPIVKPDDSLNEEAMREHTVVSITYRRVP